MTNFLLQNFDTINGLGATSGLIYLNQDLFLIGDNSGFLYKYNIENKNLFKFPILENAIDNIEKKDKPDFESITLKNNKNGNFNDDSR